MKVHFRRLDDRLQGFDLFPECLWTITQRDECLPPRATLAHTADHYTRTYQGENSSTGVSLYYSTYTNYRCPCTLPTLIYAVPGFFSCHLPFPPPPSLCKGRESRTTGARVCRGQFY